jgi:dTDP-4-dehydrorhamnose reductase
MVHIIVIGADSRLGAALMGHLASHGARVSGTSRRRPLGPDRIYLDLAEGNGDVSALPDADAAVFCAAVTGFSACRADPERARRVNVEAIETLTSHFAARGTRMLLLSTSAVFDGGSPHAADDRPRRPRTVYGRLKAEAEDIVLKRGTGAVLRLTKVVSADWDLTRDWIAALRQGRQVRAFRDHTVCPIPRNDALEFVRAIVSSGEGGVFQASGAVDIPYLEFARMIAGRLGKPQSLVAPIRADSVLPENEIARFTSLDARRLTALTGIAPLMPDTAVDRIVASHPASRRAIA